MTTARDVIQGALDRLGVTASGETATAADSALALKRLNAILRSMNISGAFLPLNSDLTASSQVPLAPSLIFGLEAMLAEVMADHYGKQGEVSAVLMRDAARGRQAIQAATGLDMTAEVDQALTHSYRWTAGNL